MTGPHAYSKPGDSKRLSCVRCGRAREHPLHTGVNPTSVPRSLAEVRSGVLEIRDGFPRNSRAWVVLTMAHEALDPEPFAIGDKIKRPDARSVVA